MPYPEFIKARRIGGAITVPGMISIPSVDVLGVLNEYMERWDTALQTGEAVLSAAPPGPQWELASALLTVIADGVSKFKSDAFLKSTLAAFYAALE